MGDYRQHQTDLNTERENKFHIDYDYTIGDKVLVRKDGILHWTITTVQTNGTIRVQCGSKSERLNSRIFFETEN